MSDVDLEQLKRTLARHGAPYNVDRDTALVIAAARIHVECVDRSEERRMNLVGRIPSSSIPDAREFTLAEHQNAIAGLYRLMKGVLESE